jgi:formamidopyrimidine-DNA glycosylase
MPELPEVETIVRQLAGRLPGHRFREVAVYRHDLLREPAPAFRKGLEGREVSAVTRRGKNILLHLSGQTYLLVNLGMTGQLLFRPCASGEELPRHLAVAFSLEAGASLLYADVRRFGHLLRYSREDWEVESRRLGPEPLERALSPRAFHAALQASRSPIRSWLLDQTRVAGIGNIYASESLFRAGIHPQRPARSLREEESKALLLGIREVLRKAIRARGTTLRDYRTAAGDPGGFGPALQVYGREGEECPTCKARVERVVFANRSAFFCPRCQAESS